MPEGGLGQWNKINNQENDLDNYSNLSNTDNLM